ncbi:hypothetical protein F3Y22_tig00014773pilonHSYRG00058 [Hibiscus syriacus]|uniref:Reverse transcriptase Ty1/copia-type domain-containing protein n=1 Tax=Hibiscus syriacus TaxID=106335 RepID=A0A6A3C1R1_HIBSY|nr:hypothetical protein F3Y22_tig00014773pilonHSYRG00058 [Hibiscus syriacus]
MIFLEKSGFRFDDDVSMGSLQRRLTRSLPCTTFDVVPSVASILRNHASSLPPSNNGVIPLADFASSSTVSTGIMPKVFTVQALLDGDEPITVHQKLNSPTWKGTVLEEYNALVRNDTLQLVPLRSGKTAIGCKWLLRIKKNTDGSIAKRKDRLVEKVDINNAFLNGELNDEVFMVQPPGFEQHSSNGTQLVCKLDKALYGLKQAAHIWTRMRGAHHVPTPMVVALKLCKDGGSSLSNPQLYRSVVGTLLYLNHTRPNIAFSVNNVAQYMHDPQECHWVTVKRILRYLSGTLDFGLVFRKSALGLNLKAFCDAGWASNIDDRCSILGFCVFLGGDLVSWGSKHQYLVSRSTIEVEYHGIVDVNAVKFNEYASVVVTAGYDRSLRAWDCRSHSTEPIQIIDSFSDTVMSVCLTKTEIIGGSVDGTVRTFDIRIGREISDDLEQPVNCISMSNDGNCILASCLDSSIRLLDRFTGELLQEYKGHACKSYKMDCCLTNSDAHVIGGSEDGSIFFWDLVDASVVSKFQAHSSVVTSVSYHSKDNCMITSSVDGSVRVGKHELMNTIKCTCLGGDYSGGLEVTISLFRLEVFSMKSRQWSVLICACKAIVQEERTGICAPPTALKGDGKCI